MVVTLFLKQKGVFAILARGRAVSLQVRKVECGRMSTSCEAHQVGGIQKYSAIDEPHLNSSLFITPLEKGNLNRVFFGFLNNHWVILNSGGSVTIK
jgi:hypothetical protein